MKMTLPDVIGHETQSQHYQHHRGLCLDLFGRITTPDIFSYHTGPTGWFSILVLYYFLLWFYIMIVHMSLFLFSSPLYMPLSAPGSTTVILYSTGRFS